MVSYLRKEYFAYRYITYEYLGTFKFSFLKLFMEIIEIHGLCEIFSGYIDERNCNLPPPEIQFQHSLHSVMYFRQFAQ